MINKAVDVLILTLFVNQVIHVFGKLTALRGLGYYGEKKVICVSEDDGGALVWNSVFNFSVHVSFTSRFHDTCKFSGHIDCKMNDNKGCLEQWNRGDWMLTHSMDTPMGPVFDQRWEEFTQYELHMKHTISLYKMRKVVVPFSVYAMANVNILICKNESKTDLCYWIVIGGWENTRSVIRKCPKGLPSIERYPLLYILKNTSECIEVVHLKHKVLSLHEWKSFVLTWNSATRNISLYDPDHLIMSYEDTESYDDLHIFHGIFFSYPETRSLIRYHNYTFLFTRKHSSLLQSPEFSVRNNVICLQLLIGLCPVCEAIVFLIDVISKDLIGFVIVNGSSTAHGLPMWQSVKITNNLLKPNYNKLSIVVIPKLSTFAFNHSFLMWAVANVRECPPKECLRMAEDIIDEDYRTYDKYRTMICQKLFYQEQSIVNLLSDAKLNVEFDDANCDLGYVGPKCTFACGRMLNRDANCKGVTICNKNGCTCPPGFRGPNCNQSCNIGFYGHACKNRCGSCQNKLCGPTGICAIGCKHRPNYTYVPPLCQIDIPKPDIPKIVFTNQTTIIVTVPIKWKDNYKTKILSYSFRIESLDKQFKDQQDWKQIFSNTTQLIGAFQDLKPDTSYNITCILSIDQLEITKSDWKIVETNCTLPYAPRNLSYSFDTAINGVVDLKWLHPRKTCGLDLCCFRITIQEISSSLRNNTSRSSKYEISKNLQTYNTRLYLLPSTLYNISIQIVTMRNETGDTNSLSFRTQSNLSLDGKVEVWTSNSAIVLRIPKVLYDTRDSMIYIVGIGSNICKKNAILSKHLLKHIDHKKIKYIWKAIEAPTNKLADTIFTMGGNYSTNCLLKFGEPYEIVVIITEKNFSDERVVFKQEISRSYHFAGHPAMYYEMWFISTILILGALSAICYFYQE